MRRALVIPKVAAAAICLIIAVVLSFPVMSVMSNRLFGGGMLDFAAATTKEYGANKPVDGMVHYIIGASSGDSSGEGASKGSYYYVAPVGGSFIDAKNKVDTGVLIKAEDGSKVYKELNEVYRQSSNGYSESGYSMSGVMKKISEDEWDLCDDIISDSKHPNLQVADYVLDLTTPVSTISARFFISLVFYVLTVFGISLVISAVNKNAKIEFIEDERMAYKMEQDRKSGNTNDDGTDKMFGDSDASFGVKPGSGAGGYKPTFQSQGGGEEPSSGRQGGGFLDDSDYQGGSQGSGFLDDSGYQGGSQGGGFLDDSDYQGGSQSGGYLDDGGYQGGYSDGFFGGGQSGYNGNDDGFFGG